MLGVACGGGSGAPDVLLGVERGEHYGLVVHFGGVLVDGGGGLGAEVAVAGVEVERGDVVSAVRAGELHATFDASDGVEAFHRIECSPLGGDEKARGVGSEGNEGGVPKWERVRSLAGSRGRLSPHELWWCRAKAGSSAAPSPSPSLRVGLRSE